MLYCMSLESQMVTVKYLTGLKFTQTANARVVPKTHTYLDTLTANVLVFACQINSRKPNLQKAPCLLSSNISHCQKRKTCMFQASSADQGPCLIQTLGKSYCFGKFCFFPHTHKEIIKKLHAVQHNIMQGKCKESLHVLDRVIL